MALKDLYRIEKGEHGWVAGLAGGLFILTVGTVMLGRLLEAFVIKRIGVEYLPYLNILSAVVVFGGTWLILRYLSGWRPVVKGLFYGGVAAAGAVLLVLLEGVFTSERTPAFNFLFVFIGLVVGALAAAKALTKVRNVMSSVLSYEQFERLSPLLSSAVTAGVLVGGLLLSLLSEAFSLRAMYALVAVVLAASVPLFLFLRLLEKGTPFERPAVATDERTRGWLDRLFLKSYVKDARLRRFLALLAVIVGLSAVFGRIFGYALGVVADERYPSEEELNAFFGTFTFAVSLATILFINLFQGKLLERYGLTRNLFTPPFVVLAAAAVMTLYPLFGFVVAAVFLRELVLDIQESAYDSMLEGVSDHRRRRAWAWIRSIVRPGFDLAASLLLLGIGFLFLPRGAETTVRVLGALAVALLLVRVLVTIRFKEMYPGVLLASLKEGDFKTRLRAMEAMAEMKFMRDRHLDDILDVIRNEEEPSAIRVTAFRAVARIQDPSALRVVARFLDHPDDAIRLAALRAVAAFTYHPDRLHESGFSRHALIAALRRRFPEEKDPEAVNAIVDGLIALRDPDIIPFLIAELKNPSPEVRHSVLHSLRTFSDPAIIDRVRPFLKDPAAHVRSQAIAAIWRFPWERRGYLKKTIEELFAAPDGSEERKQALYLAGALHLGRYRKELREALDAPDEREKIIAAEALLKLGDASGLAALRHVLREGTPEEAREVARLAHHPDVPERQQALIEASIHHFHLHYPPDLPVSEPLRVRLKDIPKGCLEGLLAYYSGPEAAADRRKIETALRREEFPDPKGRVVLAGVPDPWREMAAVALLADGWLVREAPVDEAFDESVIVVADVASERFPSRTVLLTGRAGGLADNEVAKSHYAPSELVTAVRKIAS